MSTIKAPFNFVPLSEKVFFPDWADQISQDIPFSDGLSGTIELKITAESPIFVRNGYNREDKEAKNADYKSFSKTPDGKYFIPGTSIKGAIRNVLEIMSFGKMSKVADNRYSIRDLQLKEYMSYFQNTDIHCGWMTKNRDVVTITDNGIPRRISHSLIDEKLSTDFCQKFSDKDFLKKDSNRSSLCKYKLAHGKQLSYRFSDVPLNPKNVVDKRIKVKFDINGTEGTIVFTGQPSFRKAAVKNADGTIRQKASGKFYEFVFLEESGREFTLNCEEENGVYMDFCFVYKDSEEWKFWKRKLENGERIPVFFSLKDNTLVHFGLSYLYKLPYIKRIKDYLSDEHKKNQLDLSDCIFGTVDKKSSLKGRVQFSNAFCVKGKPCSEMMNPYMGSPQPTYYPIYLKQNGSDGIMQKDNKGILFSTMLKENAELRGWKRYPIQENWQESFNIPENQDNNTNPFYPMEKGAEFACKLRFFNLKEIELGALLNSVSLNEGYYHSIGFAKPFGYGKISISIENIHPSHNIDIQEYKQIFVAFMSEEVDNYQRSEQLKELKCMMRPQNLTVPLEYMELGEFVEHKKQHFKEGRNQTFGQYQQNYSVLIKKQVQQPITKVAISTEQVSVWQGKFKQAKLTEGKDLTNKTLIVNDKKAKLKIGDLIEVKVVKKGGNVEKLEYIRKK